MSQYDDPVFSHSYSDLLIPGVQVELDPDEAEALGAFEETALSEIDAWEANSDVYGEDDRYGE
jgi:hypothetical protein